jgi:hypothetical protein
VGCDWYPVDEYTARTVLGCRFRTRYTARMSVAAATAPAAVVENETDDGSRPDIAHGTAYIHMFATAAEQETPSPAQAVGRGVPLYKRDGLNRVRTLIRRKA